MKRGLQLLSLACLCSSLIATAAAQEGQTAAESAKERHLAGHSRFGAAFDEGPRERPAKMTGIGVTHFPITTSHPEAQMWFDQGHTLIHSFWYYEAERAFRWAAKLDPEAPMPYWGLVRATGGARARAFMKEASARKAKASPRERAYIEAWELQFADGAQTTEGRRKFTKALESIVMKFPDDIEAKALLGQEMMGSTRVGTEFLMQQVLAKDPKHPGAHHYRIHNWDDEDGALALDSCRMYGDIATGIGHALHMPGHIYAGVGMFHESAIALDSATRAEIGYMGRQMVFPYNTWNYAHNRNYLSYAQEQLGLPSEAIRGARELLAVPLDPSLNVATRMSPHWQGVSALARALIKFERWDDVLKDGSIPWGDSLRDRLGRRFAEASAHLGKKNLEAATKAVDEHAALKADVDKDSSSMLKRQFEVQDLELRGTLAILKGDAIDGITLLTQAAPKELEYRSYYDDPPCVPDADVVETGLRVPRSAKPETRRRRVRSCAQGRAERSVRARRPRPRPSRPRREQACERRDGSPGLRLERRRARAPLARCRACHGCVLDAHRSIAGQAAELPEHDPRSIWPGDLGAECGAGAGRHRSDREAHHARPVPRQERAADVLPRRRLRALRQAGEGSLGACRRMGSARHRRHYREPGCAREQRQIAGAVAAEGDARLGSGMGERAPLQVVRRLRGDRAFTQPS